MKRKMNLKKKEHLTPKIKQAKDAAMHLSVGRTFQAETTTNAK